MKFSWLGALAALSALAPLGAAAAPSGPVVSTVLGRVEGIRQGGSNAFLGLPFAQPPVGTLRWRPPAEPSAWKSVRSGAQFSPNCFQRTGGARFGPYTPEFMGGPPVSEDCLYLNVWTPASGGRDLPVLVFIHGGGFSGGAGSLAIYNGANLAAKGAVVVTINYRVGPFGFMAHPELTAESPRHTSGNYGLLDQIAALKWVRANIDRFGGDPSLVTIAGQSAGAFSVNDLIMSPDAKGLFSGAISESGAAAGWPTPTLAAAERDGATLAAKLGAKSIADMRALPAQTIVDGYGSGLPIPGQPRVVTAANVDGVVLPDTPLNPLAPTASNVPLLTGYNMDEGEGVRRLKASTPGEFEASVRARYGAFADKVLAVYPHATDAEALASANLLPRDQVMATLALWSEARARTFGQKVFTYHFDHPYPGPEADIYGTFHTAEVPYVFGVLDQQNRPFTAEDRRVSDQLQAYWLAFMKHRTPDPSGYPAWPAVRPGRLEVMQLGDHLGLHPAVSTPERLAVLRDIMMALGPFRII